MQWFRFYPEAINDMKLRRVARLTGETPATVIGLWVILLSIASSSPERGKLLLSATAPATIDDIEDIAGCNVTVTLQKLIETGLVTECNGVFEIPAWEKRQFEGDSSAKRVQKFRERKKQAQSAQDVTEVKRYSNAPETETETDTETETKPQEQSDGRTDGDMTKAVAAKLESVGVALTPYLIDTYIAAAQDNGIHAVLSGITAAAEQGKQQKMSYVLACIRNKAQGDSRKNGAQVPVAAGTVSGRLEKFNLMEQMEG